MKLPIRLALPLPPSVNSYYKRTTRKGSNVYVAPKVAAFRSVVAGCVLAHIDGNPSIKPLAVYVTLHPKTRGRYDVDNRAKGLLDALQHAGAITDDAQIEILELRKGSPLGAGACVVEIHELDGTKPLPAVPDKLDPGYASVLAHGDELELAHDRDGFVGGVGSDE